MNADGIFAIMVLVGTIICIGAIAIFWIRAMFISTKLVSYLREHNSERYEWMLILPGILDAPRPIRIFKYIYNDTDNDDPIIFKYKCQLRESNKLALSFFVLIILFAIAAHFFSVAWSKIRMPK